MPSDAEHVRANPNAATIMDADEMRRAWTRIAHEVLEKNRGIRDLAIVGILRKGAPLARRLADAIARIEGTPVPVGDGVLAQQDGAEHRLLGRDVLRGLTVELRAPLAVAGAGRPGAAEAPVTPTRSPFVEYRHRPLLTPSPPVPPHRGPRGVHGPSAASSSTATHRQHRSRRAPEGR